MKKTKSNTGAKMLGIAAGVVAISAATYYFWGPKAKEHQKKTKGWMIKMKGDVIEKLEGAENITEEKYHKIIDSVSTAYGKRIDTKEVKAFAGNLKKHWLDISKSAKKIVK